MFSTTIFLVFATLLASADAGHYKVDVDWTCTNFNDAGVCTSWHQHGDIDQKCFDGNTRIQTMNSSIAMKDLKIGDMVISLVDGVPTEVPVVA